jgi:hypothetical protein
MDRRPRRAEDLLMLSSAGRRLADLVAASAAPLRYEVVRHLLRVSEETMTETLEEVVGLELVKRGPDPFTYISYDEQTRREIMEHMQPERQARLRAQIENASRRVFE